VDNSNIPDIAREGHSTGGTPFSLCKQLISPSQYKSHYRTHFLKAHFLKACLATENRKSQDPSKYLWFSTFTVSRIPRLCNYLTSSPPSQRALQFSTAKARFLRRLLVLCRICPLVLWVYQLSPCHFLPTLMLTTNPAWSGRNYHFGGKLHTVWLYMRLQGLKPVAAVLRGSHGRKQYFMQPDWKSG
jgi:hypothetical protein